MEMLDRMQPNYPWAQSPGLTYPSVFGLDAAEAKRNGQLRKHVGDDTTRRQVSGQGMAELQYHHQLVVMS